MEIMWASFIPLLIFIIFFATKIAINSRGRNRRRRLPPCPASLPFIGHLHHLAGDLPHLIFRRLSKKHGPLIHLKLGHVITVVASSAASAAAILKTHDNIICSRPILGATNRISYGGLDIAFAPYNNHWRRLRRFANIEFFSTAKVQAFKSIREEEVGVLVKAISSASSCGEAFNLSPMMLCLFNNMIYRQVFGKSAGGCGRSQHHDMIMDLVAFTAEIFVGDFFPSLAWIDVLTGKRWRLEKKFQAMDRVFEHEIEGRMKRKRDDSLNACFLDALLRSQHEMNASLGFLLTRDMIKAVVTDMFLAGTDPPALTMEWAMAELLKNPKSMRRAQREIRLVAKDKGKVEDDDIPHLPYLQNIVKETLRLHPPGPLLLPRESTADAIINGYDVPAGTRVLINAWAVARDPSLWGPDSDSFRPERFEERPGVEFSGRHFGLIPFGSGRRVCPGMGLGVAGVQLALANVLYAFDWELPAGEELDMRERFMMVSHRMSPLIVVATPATI